MALFNVQVASRLNDSLTFRFHECLTNRYLKAKKKLFKLRNCREKVINCLHRCHTLAFAEQVSHSKKEVLKWFDPFCMVPEAKCVRFDSLLAVMYWPKMGTF